MSNPIKAAFIYSVALLTFLTPSTSAQKPAWSLQVLESTSTHLTVELTLHDESLTAFADWPRHPTSQLPMHSELIALPQATMPQGEILTPSPHDLSGSQIITLTNLGWWRNQPVALLQFFPFQWDTQGQLMVYTRLRVRLTFDHVARSRQASDPLTPFIAQTVLNGAAVGHYQTPNSLNKMAFTHQPQLKVLLEQPGLYQVTYADLIAIDPNWVQGDPRYLALSRHGQSVPLQFVGEADGVFDPTDYFLFYATITPSDYTREEVFWLTQSKTIAPRISNQTASPLTHTSSLTMFMATQTYEQDLRYWSGAPVGADHWFWRLLQSQTATPTITATQIFTLPALASSGGQVRLRLYGGNSGQHQLAIYLNGQRLGTSTWSGIAEYIATFTLTRSLSLLNRLQLVNHLPATQTESIVHFNRFEIDYHAPYQAIADSLLFTVPVTQTVVLTGFSQPMLDILDLTIPTQPQYLTDYVVEPMGQNYHLRFTARPAQYLAQTTTRRLSPQLKPYIPPPWPITVTGATYLMVTHPNFYTVTQTLADYRRNQGQSVVVVKTTDLYDTFSYGRPDPQAIHDFVAYAFNQWQPQPLYLLLVGDASLDPKNNRGNSLPDFLPAHYVDIPVSGQAPSDNWYGQVHGTDPYPDVMVGRISARTPADMQAVIAKIQRYEQPTITDTWRQHAILVADDDEPTFQNDMEHLALHLPLNFTLTKLYGGQSTNLVNLALNQGALLLAYSGHGNVETWGQWTDQYRIFKSSNVNELQNESKWPFMMTFTCSNGTFDEYSRDHSLAEEMLLQPNKGSIASFASTGYGYPTSNTALQNQLYQHLLSPDNLTLGTATNMALVAAMSQRPDLPSSLFESMLYFGDPATRLISAPQNYKQFLPVIIKIR